MDASTSTDLGPECPAPGTTALPGLEKTSESCRVTLPGLGNGSHRLEVQAAGWEEACTRSGPVEMGLLLEFPPEKTDL